MEKTQPQVVATDEYGAASFLGVKVSCMRGWRFRRQGPPYVRVGRLVRYRVSDLEAFLESNRVEPQEGDRRVTEALTVESGNKAI